MYSWNDFINDFPYTNFSDINVSWFLNKFKQIFDEWAGLYSQLQTWKTATDEYNANWREQQETAFTTWENNFNTAIDAWKVQTESDINTWESNTLENLETWKTAFITQYNALKAEVEQIAEDAENAKNSAQASATSAQQSAESASATAINLQNSLSQINTNTIDISKLKTEFSDIVDTQTITYFSEDEVSGTRSTTRSVTLPAGTYILNVDNVDSTAEGTTSNLNFFGSGAVVKAIAIPRYTGYHGIVTLENDVDTIYFYGKNTYPDSIDAVFTFYNVKVSKDTRLNDRLKAVENEIVVLNDNVENVENVVSDMYDIKYNYFNKDNAVDGYYYSGSVGQEISTTALSTMAGIIFPVVSGKSYVVRRTDFRWYALDVDRKVIANHGNNTGKDYLTITPTDEGVKYVAISWVKAYAPIDSYMILDPGVSFGNYVEYPYSIVLKDDVLNASGAEYHKIYTVGATGDFATFTEMLKALKNDTTPKIVYVQNGVYDIFTEMGGQTYMESLTDETWFEACDIVPQNTKIIGVGNVVLSYHPTDENIISYDKGWLISPLNIIYSCEIENITIDCDNCRYGIHIEEGSGAGDAFTANIKLKNVRVNRSKNGLMGDHPALGCGVGHNAKWYFDNCRFATDGQSAVFLVHTNAPSVDSSAYIEFNNCVIFSNHVNAHDKNSMEFSSLYLPVAITNYVNISNCYNSGKIATTTNNTSTKRQSYDINLVGGTSYGIHDSEDKTSGFDIKNFGNNILV